jgi:uncharacterized protein
LKVVIDTNDFISALIGKSHRKKLEMVFNHSSIEIYADENLINEIKEVAYRDKFRKYVSTEDVDIFIEIIKYRLHFIKSTSKIFDSTDPDDNYLLELAVDSGAEYLITGDKKHLLSLNPYMKIQIIRLSQFLEILV